MGERRVDGRFGAHLSRLSRVAAVGLVGLIWLPLTSSGFATSAGAAADTTVSGVVTWEAGPSGDYFMQVCWYNFDIEGLHSGYGCVTPDASGNYSLSVPSEFQFFDLKVDVLRRDGRPGPMDYVADMEFNRVPPNAASPVQLDIQMVLQGIIWGSVSFPDGSHPDGPYVCAETLSGAVVNCSYADSNAQYYLHVPLGQDYNVRFSPGHGWFYEEYYDDAVVPPDGSIPPGATPISFSGGRVQQADAIVEPMHYLTGTVTFASGAVAADATVCRSKSGFGSVDPPESCVDVDPATGAYSLRVDLNGDYLVWFQSRSGAFVREFYSDVFSDGESLLDPPSGAQRVRVGTALATTANAVVDAPSSISGNVTDEVHGDLQHEILVCLEVKSDPVYSGAGRSYLRCIPTAGDYTFPSVPPGYAWLTFAPHYPDYDNYVSEMWDDLAGMEGGQPIVIPGGIGASLTGYDAALTPIYPFSIAVTDDAGNPLDGIDVCALMESGSEVCFDSYEGHVSLNVPHGNFTLRLVDPDGVYATQYWGDSVDVGGATVVGAASGSAAGEYRVQMHLAATPTTMPSTVVVPATNTTTSAVASSSAPAVTTSTTAVVNSTTAAAPGVSTTTSTSTTTTSTSTATAATVALTSGSTTTPAAQVLGARQIAAAPTSRTGSSWTAWMVVAATASVLAGTSLLAMRRRRQASTASK